MRESEHARRQPRKLIRFVERAWVEQLEQRKLLNGQVVAPMQMASPNTAPLAPEPLGGMSESFGSPGTGVAGFSTAGDLLLNGNARLTGPGIPPVPDPVSAPRVGVLPDVATQLDDSITGTASSDQFTLMQDADHQHIDWTVNGSLNTQIPINDPNGLILDGLGGSDVITLLYTNGNPLPNIMHLNSSPLVNNGNFTINGLAGADPLATTTLDLGKSKVFLSYSSGLTNASAPDPISMVRGWLSNGYNGGTWTGTADAINSSAAAINHGYMIGYADSADGIVANQPSNTIELIYTLGGDLALAGTVNFADFARLVSDYGKPASWDGGALSYGATVSIADFALLVSNYGKQASLAASAVNAASVPPSTGSSAGDASPQLLPAIQPADPALPPAHPVRHPVNGSGERR
jgi:hypothetical protein